MFKVGDLVTPIRSFQGLTIGKSYTIINSSSNVLIINDDNDDVSYYFIERNFVLTSLYLTNKEFNNTLTKILE